MPLVDPLENLLIEHPSMSVYQMTTEEEDLASDEEEEDTARYIYSLLLSFTFTYYCLTHSCVRPKTI